MMLMKTQILMMATVAIPAAVFGQVRIYFDENWEVTTQDKIVYYRETTRQGNLYHIRDYYKNGILQMDALSQNDDPNNERFEGKVTYYTPDGKEESYTTYKNGQLDGESYTRGENGDYSRNIFKNGEMVSGESQTYDADTGLRNIYRFKDKITTTVSYENDPRGIREEQVIQEDGTTISKYYGEGGKLLGTLKYADGEPVGTMVTYHYKPMRVASIQEYKKGAVVASKSYYTTGQLQQEYKINGKTALQTSYDRSGKIIGRLESQVSADGESMHQTGVEISFDGDEISQITHYKNGNYTRLEDYKNGKLWQLTEYEVTNDGQTPVRQTTYGADGRPQFVLTYKDGMEYNGTYVSGNSQVDYREGRMMAQRYYYENGKLNYTTTLNPVDNTESGTVYFKNGEKYSDFLSRDSESGYFTGTVNFYTNGRRGKSLEFKEGILQGGKMRYFSDTEQEPVELENDGRNYWYRTFRSGELFSELRMPAKFSGETEMKIALTDLYRTEGGSFYADGAEEAAASATAAVTPVGQ